VASPDIRARFVALGLGPSTGSPQDFARFFAAETRKWAGVVAIAGIPAE
jgi:tripartite-type tricarboxylate transporter receptor subunit TctC